MSNDKQVWMKFVWKKASKEKKPQNQLSVMLCPSERFLIHNSFFLLFFYKTEQPPKPRAALWASSPSSIFTWQWGRERNPAAPQKGLWSKTDFHSGAVTYYWSTKCHHMEWYSPQNFHAGRLYPVSSLNAVLLLLRCVRKAALNIFHI